MATKAVSDEERQEAYDAAELVSVPSIRRSYTYLGGSYGPSAVPSNIPRGLADTLGLTYGEPVASKEAAAPGEAKDWDSLTKAELEAEAEKRGLTVKRGDGEDGDPVKADYVKALKAASKS